MNAGSKTTADKAAANKKRSAPYHHGNLKQALIDATVALIMQNGAANVTVAQAAKQAGVSSGAPFRHFSDRKALMTAVALDAMELFKGEISKAMEEMGNHDALAKFGAIGQAFIRWSFHHPAHFEIISTRSLIDFDNSSLRENNDGIRTLMGSLLTQASEQGLLKRDDIANLGIEARALVYGLARMYIDGQFPSWELGTDKPVQTALSILDEYLRSLRA
jgi:AcrR family transcriptional regulator